MSDTTVNIPVVSLGGSTFVVSFTREERDRMIEAALNKGENK
jgi:hypothetical protein